MTTISTTQAPVALYGFLTPKPGHADELRRLLTELVEPSRGHEGNLQYHLHEQEDGRFFLYEVWRSQEDLDRHNATPLLRAFMDGLPDHVEGAPEAYRGTMRSAYPGPVDRPGPSPDRTADASRVAP
ncbi:antibiotic biosynthesis monooxygenase [Planomonospora sp. ID91781]|uniref:putative quinol monooxygenase n=1 Tax=Planomonospora TaxID=1998 RepID=UPI00083A74E7|nr:MULTISPECIES: putative quinol monooxygenase [Planomonospora]MBG0824762.1 antibiotic biosynthesis monooxygenase [Planomonospora sp. ID91781]